MRGCELSGPSNPYSYVSGEGRNDGAQYGKIKVNLAPLEVSLKEMGDLK